MPEHPDEFSKQRPSGGFRRETLLGIQVARLVEWLNTVCVGNVKMLVGLASQFQTLECHGTSFSRTRPTVIKARISEKTAR